MENQKTSKSLGEVVFTGACLAVAGLVLLLPFHNLQSQKAPEQETSNTTSNENLGREHSNKEQDNTCKDCTYQEKHFLINGEHYTLEVADTEEKRMLGLGKRDTLCDDCGMLFVFEKPGKYGFWMKDMHFHIDILWVKNGKIIYKKSNASPQETETFTPPEEADSVIEILPNSEVRVGDRVQVHTHDE